MRQGLQDQEVHVEPRQVARRAGHKRVRGVWQQLRLAGGASPASGAGRTSRTEDREEVCVRDVRRCLRREETADEAQTGVPRLRPGVPLHSVRQELLVQD